ncbi:MAG TPA: T9SS type A sorting domain-containing protein [Rubricoccaceae bacterium]|jgi:hypothetical protein
MRRLLLLVLLLPALATAQTPGACTLGTAQATLATPDLSATLFNTGSLFYGNSSAAAYTVPRARGTSPVYAAGLWAGGRVGSEVRTAGGTYGPSPGRPFTFWPGPLDAGAALPNPSSCAAFDRIWLVTPADVAAYEAGGTPAVDLREWPVGLGAPAVDAQGQPVPAVSWDQRIDLPGGERPVLGGGPTAFWVMNDVGNSHGTSGSAPLGIEVQTTAFAPAVGALAFRQATVYRYRVVNRNSVPITDFHLGMFADPDLGDAVDDYVGADTTRGMPYVYNADNADGTGAGTSYGTPPPAFGFDVLSGFQGTSRITNQGAGRNDPESAVELYNRLRGLWNDGTVIRACGTGYAQTQGQVVRSTFPGDPVMGMPWSEVNPGCGSTSPNAPGDRRLMLSAPPVTLAPGATTTFDVALVFAQGANNLASITALRSASDRIQTAYDAGVLFSGQLANGTATAPTLVAPAENAYIADAPVTFSWSAVAVAEGYVFELGLTPDFSELEAVPTTGTSLMLPAARFPPNRTAPVYWRVRTVAGGLDGPPGAARALRVYRFVGAPLALASGARAYVETVAPGGAPACSGPGDPDEGCAEVSGDLVYESPNSTGAYRLVNTLFDPDSPAAFAPNDFEIRFTPRGSYAYVAAVNSPVAQRLFRVPFELWDIGVVPPGSTNDPEDDQQLVPRFSATNGSGGPCDFDFSISSNPGIGDSLTTRFITSHYPVSNDYAAYEALAAAAVATGPSGCPTTSSATAAATARVDIARGRPLYGFAFEQGTARSVSDLVGTTVRFYTADRAVASEADPVATAALLLGMPYPNPARGAITVAVSLSQPGRLRLVDVLGRTVLEEPLRAGSESVRLDTRRLASGAYAVVLEAGNARVTRTVTVVR